VNSPKKAYEEDGTWEDGSVIMIVQTLWGEVENPERSVDALFALANDQSGTFEDSDVEMVDDPTDHSYGGVVLKCQATRGTEEDPTLGYEPEGTMCAWAEDSTAGLVYFSPIPDMPEGWDPESGEPPENIEPPEEISTDQSAEYTKQLREDSIQPLEDGGDGGGNGGDSGGGDGGDNNLDDFENGP
jgi:hypothetical protein